MPVLVKRQAAILQAIVGTAGHVDHGKTSLVKLLTGCDTDRLPEEKARGMSIDLGFAPCVLRDDGDAGTDRRIVGIVDVPGHRDFIRNMVAGAASVDVLLLVIAADDGVMPQTMEHMQIVRLLRKPRVMVALTKIDMVSPERLQMAEAEVRTFLSLAGFDNAPVIHVSNRTGEGIGEVREKIDELVGLVCAEKTNSDQANDRAFRMNVERVFSVKGYGTVVTGIPRCGAASVGDKVELLPSAGGGGRELTVRTVQVYKMESQRAVAGSCCAINVRKVDAEQVSRGMTIASPGVYQPTLELIVQLENASEPAMTLKRRFDVRLHTGTAAVEASVKLLKGEELAPGAQGAAHVALAAPIVAAAGDRFIVRSLSPADTLGGGVVLSAKPQRLRRHADHATRLSSAVAAVRSGDVLGAELLAGPTAVVIAAEAMRLTQATGDAAKRAIAQAVASGILADLSGDGGGDFVVRPRLQEIRAVLLKLLERYHRANPYAWGMPPTMVCQRIGVAARNFDRLAALLAEDPFITVRHGRLALSSFKPNISERLMTLRTKVLSVIEQAGVNAPARGNLMKDLAIVEADMKILEKILCSDGGVVVLDGNFMLRSVLDRCREVLLKVFEKHEIVELNVFKDALGTNRKMAVAMLDAFDAEGLTKRTAAGRVLAKKPAVQK